MTPAEKHLVDALDTAADALERLAREQDAAVALFQRDNCRLNETIAALATSSGEAASAVAAVVVDSPDLAAHKAAQVSRLNGVGTIPSATLRTWAAGWRALAGAL